MPPHELKSTFTSKIFNRDLKKYVPDFLGNFDLTMISDAGNMASCKRNPSGEPITGQAWDATPNPFSYHVEINQTTPIPARYDGVGLRNDAGEVTRIVGRVKYNFSSADQRRELAGDMVLNAQDETTWVVTKP